MINKVTLLGRVGTVDPDNYREYDSGAISYRFSLATTNKWFNKKTKTYDEDTTWHTIECWSHTAKYCNEYVEKGDLLYIDGAIKVNEYEKNGEKKKFTSVLATSVKKVSSSKKSEPSSGDTPF